jgi:hypothetical protein
MSDTTRTRSRGTLSPLSSPQYSRFDYNCAGGSQLLWTGTPSGTGTKETMTDVVIKNFKQRQKNGELFFNPMSYSKVTYEPLSWNNWSIKRNNTTSCSSPVKYEGWTMNGNDMPRTLGSGSTVDGCLILPSINFIPTDEVSRLQGEIATRMFDQRGRSDINLFETLAEADQTLGLFDRPISKMTRLLKSAAEAKRKGRFTGYAANGMSNLYLAYRYGIKPILNDIEGITEGLKKKVGQQRKTTRAKGGFEATSTSTSSFVWDTFLLTVQTDITESYTVRCMNLDDVNLTYQDHLGFAPKGLITLPWELVSHSFVADWFLNIGDFIGAMVPAFGWNSLGRTMMTIHGNITRYTIVNCVQQGAFSTISPAGGSWQTSTLTKTRGPVPSPQIVVRNDFRFHKATRVADAMALIGQKMTSVFR